MKTANVYKGPEIYSSIRNVNIKKSVCLENQEKCFGSLDNLIEDFLSSKHYILPKEIDEELCNITLDKYQQHEEKQKNLDDLRKEARENRDKLKRDEINRKIEEEKERDRIAKEKFLKDQQEKELENKRKEEKVKQFMETTSDKDINTANF